MSIELTGAEWFKSSRSATRDTCVEVAHLDSGRIGVRDSTDPTGPALVFEPAAWDAFTTGIQDRKFDRP